MAQLEVLDEGRRMPLAAETGPIPLRRLSATLGRWQELPDAAAVIALARLLLLNPLQRRSRAHPYDAVGSSAAG
jgi:hypothetical protein